MCGVATLRRIYLFAGLSDQDLELVAGRLGTRTFGKGIFIFHKGSPGHVLYIILSGRVRIFVTSDMGQELSLNIHGPGDIFGEFAVLDSLPRSAGAVTMETTTTYTLRREDLTWLLDAYPQVARNIIHMLVARLRYTSQYAEDLAFLDVNRRVAARLLELSERYGVPGSGIELGLGLTQAELASWVAASRESVNRTLCAFRELGLIQMEDGRIMILDRVGLERQVHG